MQSTLRAVFSRPLNDEVTNSQPHMCACRLSGLTVWSCSQRRPQHLTERGQRGAPGSLWRPGGRGAESAVHGSAGLILCCWRSRGHWSGALPHSPPSFLSAEEKVESRSIATSDDSRALKHSHIMLDRCTQLHVYFSWCGPAVEARVKSLTRS